MQPTSPPQFDPSLIERYAEQLYRKADSVRVGSAVFGAGLGVVFGAVPMSPLGKYLPIPSSYGLALVLLGGLVGGFLGYVVGQGRAFRIRLQAQLMLFQLQIERNTHQGTATAPVAAPVAPPAPVPVAAAPAPAAVQAVPQFAPVLAAPPPPAPVIPVQPARPAVAVAAGGGAGRAVQQVPVLPQTPAPQPVSAPRPLQAVPAAEHEQDDLLLPPLSP